MKTLCLFLTCCIAAASLIGYNFVRSASAFPTFYKAFDKTYLGDKTTDAQKALAANIKRVKKCNVCHDPRKDEHGKASKKNRNPYGRTLAKFLTEKDKKNLKKALEVIPKVESQRAEGDKETFGQLIKEGKLPFEYQPAK